MRAVTIRRRNVVEDRKLLLAPHLREIMERWMQAEEPVEIDGRARSTLRQSECSAERCVIRITVGRHRGEPIQPAAQDEDNETAVVRQCSVCKPRAGAGGNESCTSSACLQECASV